MIRCGMADQKEELTLIRMLIEQNGETIQLMRSLIARADERDEREGKRVEQLLEMIQMTGAIDLIAKRLHEPRIVKPEEATIGDPHHHPDGESEENVG